MILTAITAALYPFAIQYKRKGLWRILTPLTFLTAILDVVANYTEVAFVFGKPVGKDYTITRRFRRMEESDPLPSRREFAKIVNTFLHACEPDGRH